MRDRLLQYYENELSFLRKSGEAFASQYPSQAARLRLEPSKCEDPHVERLLEGFAFLAARVHLRIDDDFSEISESLLGVVAPSYLRPTPACTIVQFHLDPDQGKLTTGLALPSGSSLVSQRSIEGIRLRFRTCWETTLWPVEVSGARWAEGSEIDLAGRPQETDAALVIELSTLPEVPFSSLNLTTLRFHLSGEEGVSHALLEALSCNVLEVLARDPSGERPPVKLGGAAIQPIGFDPSEALFPVDGRAFDGHRVLREYFAFPEKFLFVELGGMDRIREAGFGERVEVVVLLSALHGRERRRRLAANVSRDSIRLGCVPAVNLHARDSEPIRVTGRQAVYPLVADARRGANVDVFSVDEVLGQGAGSASPTRFEPFFGLRHGVSAEEGIFWFTSRRSFDWRPAQGHDLMLSLVDASGRGAVPDEATVTARLTCHNGRLPSQLGIGATRGDFVLEGGGPISRIEALLRPSDVLHPPVGTEHLWRMISLLALNLVALTDGGAEALRETLRLFEFRGSPAALNEIEGVEELSSEPCYRRIRTDSGVAFGRGQRVRVRFNEERFGSKGAHLIASVLDRFMAHSVSLNSFVVVAAESRQRGGLIREWPPRGGGRELL